MTDDKDRPRRPGSADEGLSPVPTGDPGSPNVAALETRYSVEREVQLDQKSYSQGQLVRRRFVRHRGAMVSLFILVFVTAVAYTSIGLGPIPGWWDKGYLIPFPIVNGGSPTLSIFPPSLGEHPMGQETIGKDFFALTMRGTQSSLTVAFVVGALATTIGTVVGALAGYFRGITEEILMRATDLFIVIPLIVLAAVVAKIFGGSVWAMSLALGILVWTGLARLIRGEVLSLREREFVTAAEAIGTSPGRIIFRHILPNTIGTIIVNATLTISIAILVESALSFLGYGILPPDTSLGQLISTYQTAFITRPWLFWWPGMIILAIALSVNFLGDGLRDAFDPRQSRSTD